MKNIQYAVVGLGGMGRNHVRVVSELPNATLVAVCDSNRELAQAMGQKYGCPWFVDLSTLLESVRVDAVSLCTPTSTHADLGTDIVEKGVNLLVEKPIAASVASANALVQAAADSRVMLCVGHVERFNPAVQKVKEIISKGELGELVAITARRVGAFPPQIRDANIAVDLAIHDIDIVNFIVGSTPNRVVSNKKRNHVEMREDSVEFFMVFNHCSAYIQANWITPVKIRKLNLTCLNGYLELDYIEQKIVIYKSNYEKYRITDEGGGFSDYIVKYLDPDRIEIQVARQEPLRLEVLDFLDRIEREERVDVQYAIDALALASGV
jgi:UDP-N-acetylglucosamine 3-dehydrogenase